MILPTRSLYRCVLLVFLFPLTLFAQEQIRVQFRDTPGRSASIQVFRQQGMLYGSLSDLADVFDGRTYENSAARKIEIKKDPFALRLTADNPFIVVQDQSQRQRVHQLHARVILAGGSYYAPLVSLLPYLAEVVNQPLSFDASTKTLSIAATPATASGKDFSTLLFETKANGMLIRIPCSRPLTDFESWLRDDGWLYVTIPDARADVNAINRLKPGGLLKQIVAIQSPSSVQLTFKLKTKIAASDIFRAEGSNDILISLRTPGAEDKVLLEKRRREIQAGLEHQRKRWELDVIVLDAGHGGRDYGAIGVKGTREKDVTLGITHRLGKLLEKNMKDVRVVYTRKDDSFVELHRRGRIANEANGKLFVSIHANSLPRKPSPTRGFEIYLLRPGRTDDAVAIAARENSVIELEEGFEQRYQKLTDENFILVTMAQSAYVRASEVFADIAQQEMGDHLNIPNRGVKQAGFLVLVGASMPNVLVETAYLSNRDDEQFLRSERGQQKIAEALFSAIKRYKAEYEKLLQEGRDLGIRSGADK